ncbi:type 2 lanthipeptide synthetase LanM [Rothia dentocariosa]|uniref:type 2 lanthipeptide synthetase LanM n=1 Tax=Rothia dentocariosa TaxID=2047 RepID=UPI002880BA40|nr:type 2 lanthipeptide synthetase LanM [Rothia dentocariosa]
MEDVLDCILSTFDSYVYNVEKKSLEILLSVEDKICFKKIDNILSSIVGQYREEIIPIIVRTQMYIKEKKFNNDNILYYQWVSSSEAKLMIQEKFPELIRLLNIKGEGIIYLIKDILERYIKDRQKLKKFGFPVGNCLKNIIFSGGDSHQGGKRVCFLETDMGKIVYKPHSVAIDDAVARAFSIINSKLGDELHLTVPDVLDRGEYGWQKFIPYNPAKNTDELSSYYRSLGGLTSFFAIFGGLDFHHENLTIDRDKAIPIDLETAFGDLKQAHKIMEQDGVLKLVGRAMILAGTNTLILPPLARSERFDIDLSPITDGSPQESRVLKSSRMCISDDGDIDILLEDSVITKDVPTCKSLSAEECHPRRFFSSFYQGYEKVTSAIFLCRKELTDLFSGFSHISNRCVIRPTSTYASFLNTSFHPDYLGSGEARNKLFSLLKYPSTCPAQIGDKVLAAECKALMNGEYPYFTDKILADFTSNAADNANVYDLKKSIEGFRVAPVEFLEILECIEHIPFNVIRYIQHGAFASIDSEAWNRSGDQEISPFFSIQTNNSWELAVQNLIPEIKNLIMIDDQNKLATMFMQSISNDDRVQTVPLNATYYEGQGIFWILHYAIQKSGKHQDRNMLAALLRGVLDPLYHAPHEPISGFIGGFSRIRLFPLVHEYLGKDIAESFVDNLITHTMKTLDNVDIDNLKIDYVTGLASALAVLGTMGSLLQSKEVYKLRDRMHNIVKSAFSKEQLQNLTGVAHGPLGVMLGIALGRGNLDAEESQTLRSQVRKRATAELKGDEQNSLETRLAWCTGKPGIAETYARVLEVTGGVEGSDLELLSTLLEECLEDIYSLNGPVDMSLCHGISGALLAWYRINICVPELKSVDKIKNAAEYLRLKITSGDIEVRGGTRHATSSLCMMLGITGVILALSYIETEQNFEEFLFF